MITANLEDSSPSVNYEITTGIGESQIEIVRQEFEDYYQASMSADDQLTYKFFEDLVVGGYGVFTFYFDSVVQYFAPEYHDSIEESIQNFMEYSVFFENLHNVMFYEPDISTSSKGKILNIEFDGHIKSRLACGFGIDTTAVISRFSRVLSAYEIEMNLTKWRLSNTDDFI